MAFFLTRSVLCIGAVAVAASGVGPVADALDRGASGAVEKAGRACLASAACLSAAGAAAAGGFASRATAARDAHHTRTGPQPDARPGTRARGHAA